MGARAGDHSGVVPVGREVIASRAEDAHGGADGASHRLVFCGGAAARRGRRERRGADPAGDGHRHGARSGSEAAARGDAASASRRGEGGAAPRGARRLGRRRQGRGGPLRARRRPKKGARPPRSRPARTGRRGPVDTVLGFGAIRDVRNDSEATTIFIASLVFGFAYRFGETWTMSARFPISTAHAPTARSATTDDFNSFAVGNLELAVRPAFRLTPRLRSPVGVAIDLPFASGDPFPEIRAPGERAQALSPTAPSARRGYEEYALFASAASAWCPASASSTTARRCTSARAPRSRRCSTAARAPRRAAPRGRGAGRAPRPDDELGDGGVGRLRLPRREAHARAPDLARGRYAANLARARSDYAGALWVVEPRSQSTVGRSTRPRSSPSRAVLGFILPVAGSLGGERERFGGALQAAFLF